MILPISVLVYSEAGYQTAAFAHIQELAAQGISSEYSLSDTREEALLYAKQKAIGRVDIISESVDVLYCGKGE